MATTTAAAPFVRCLLPRPPGGTSHADAYAGGDGSSRKRSRLVLLQHTADLTTRLTAAGDAGTPPRPGKGGRGNNPTSSSSTTDAAEDALYRLAGLRTPSEAAARDLAGGGPALVLAALEEVASRTGGRVVWVSVADHLRLPRGGGGDKDSDDTGWSMQFRRHGATVDLASDPLGWDASDDDDDEGEEKKRKEGSGGACAHR